MVKGSYSLIYEKEKPSKSTNIIYFILVNSEDENEYEYDDDDDDDDDNDGDEDGTEIDKVNFEFQILSVSCLKV